MPGNYDLTRMGGDLDAPGGTRFVAIAPGGGLTFLDFDVRMSFPFPQTSAAPNTGGPNRSVAQSGFLGAVDLTATVAVSGSPVVFDVLRSSDGGATWTSLWAANPKGRPALSVGQTIGGVPDDATIKLAAGDRLVGGIASGAATVDAMITVRCPLVP
jgi:hypothetical protein